MSAADARPPLDDLLEAAYLAGFEAGYCDPLCTSMDVRRSKFRRWREGRAAARMVAQYRTPSR